MELSLALAIFLVVLVPSIHILTSAHQLSTQSRERLLALNTARSTLETIKNTPLSTVANINTAPFIPQGLRNGAVAMNINSDTGNLATATLATITVTVTWTGPKNIPQRVDITTMRSRF